MAGPYRHQALIEAPLEDVRDVISDPRTHPDWWPEVIRVDAEAGKLAEGDEYVKYTKMLPSWTPSTRSGSRSGSSI